MENNEYRRSLIMLRSLISGYSGHARLEIRTLTGSLNIVASIPANARSIQAVLAGNRRNTYFATPLGTLRRDLRGQWGLSITFDPRSIGGRTLDAYSQLILVNTDSRCTLVLSGNLSGSCFPDWQRLRDAVCALYAPASPNEGFIPTPSLPSNPNIPAQPDTDFPPTPSLPSNPDIPAQPDTDFLPTPSIPADPPAEENTENLPTPSLPSEPTPIQPREEEPEPLSWDFTQPAEPAFSRAGWKFTRVPLPAGCTIPYSYIGVPESSDAADLCIALPGTFSPEPPAGLDDYEYSDGWWIKCYIAR